ncbi:hypothetical protein DFQ27_003592 [Actinomortierella ambigua]|uniref:Uncharacterized protein n=1 Tax=Actinomortierella ambigua TaxID=1343610 RepID=A0A9P6Q7P4_9FUNG|nr:hypothetical protein DFQ27_003592 [Actinomortierella ambigua]
MAEYAPISYDVSVYKQETASWNQDPSAYLSRYYKKHFVIPHEKYRFTDQPVAAEQHPSPLDPQSETATNDEATSKVDHPGEKFYQGDQYVYQSPNKLCVVGLAPSHPLIAQRDRFLPISIQFDSRAVSQLPQPTDKPANTQKTPPPRCFASMILCKIVARDTKAAKPSSMTTTTTTTTTTITTTAETTETPVITTSTPSTILASSTGAEEAETSERAVAVDDGPPSGSSVPDAEEMDIDTAPTSSSLPSLSDETNTAATATATNTTNTEARSPDVVVFAFRAMLNGNVLEFNERLVRRGIEVIEDPQVLGTLIDKAATHGYIAVIRLKNENLESKNFLSLEEYKAQIDPAIAATLASLPSSSKLASVADADD